MDNRSRGFGIQPIIGFLLLCGMSTGFAAEPVISIDAFSDKTIVQRESKSGEFKAKGTYTGTPQAIEVRVVDATGSNEIRKWRDATINASSKRWDVILDSIPQGGWYRVQARSQGQTANFATSTKRFGVGVILVLMGQSNMQGFYRNYCPNGGKTIKPHPLTSYASLRTFRWHDPSTQKGKGQGVVLMANNVVEKLGIPVAIINCSEGSAFIKEYTGDVQAYNRSFPDILAAAFKFVGGDVEMLIYHQGFSDFYLAGSRYERLSTLTPESLKTRVWNCGWDEYERDVAQGRYPELPYLSNLKKVHALCSKGIRRQNVPMLCGVKGRTLEASHLENLKVYFSQISKPPYDWSVGRSKQADCVRWSQMAFAKNLSYGHRLGSSIDLRFMDNAHYSKEDMFLLSSRFAQSILHMLGKETYGGGGAAFLPGDAALVEGGGILLKVKHEGGNQLVLPFPDKPVEGFIVKQPGSDEELEIRKVSLQQPDGIFIELVNQPQGDLLVAYLTGLAPVSDIKPGGMTNRPPEFVTETPPGNILYDNAALPTGNTRPGLPVNHTLGFVRVSKTIHISGKPSNTGRFFALHAPEYVSSSFVNIGYTLAKNSYVSLQIYDSRGRLSMQFLEGHRPKGMHRSCKSLPNLSNGFYTVKLRTNEGWATGKTVICK